MLFLSFRLSPSITETIFLSECQKMQRNEACWKKSNFMWPNLKTFSYIILQLLVEKFNKKMVIRVRKTRINIILSKCANFIVFCFINWFKFLMWLKIQVFLSKTNGIRWSAISPTWNMFTKFFFPTKSEDFLTFEYIVTYLILRIKYPK